MNRVVRAQEPLERGLEVLAHAMTATALLAVISVAAPYCKKISLDLVPISEVTVITLIFLTVGLSTTGAVYCLKSPTAQGVILACLTLQVATIVAGVNGASNYASLLILLSSGLLVHFVWKLGRHLGSSRLMDEVTTTVKLCLGGLAGLFVGIVTAPLVLGLLILPFALVMFLSSLFRFRKCMTVAQSELANVSSQNDPRERVTLF